MPVKGIDVSSNNGQIDFHKVKADGIDFVFVKVSEGDWMDPTAAAHVKGTKAAGLLVGGYNFIRPRAGRTGAQEFDLFFNNCRALTLDKRGCLRPVIDVEATKLGPEDTRRYVQSWIHRCVERTGKHPIVYTGNWFWEGTMQEFRHSWGCKLWIAAYTPDWRQHIPKAWRGHASFHQHTDKGRVAGIKGDVDLNTYLSTLHALKRGHTL
jgi:lysozyme